MFYCKKTSICGIVLSLLCISLLSCGDWGTDPSGHGEPERYVYRYFYAQDCSTVGYEYVCGEAYSLSRSVVIDVHLDWNGDATVYFDGRGPYSFWENEYVFDIDYNYDEYYYQFDLGSYEVLTFYTSGAEAILSDTFTGVEYHYYYDIW